MPKVSAVIFCASLAFLVFTNATAQSKSAESTSKESGKPRVVAHPADNVTSRLPVKRVVLYKNGIGYFEHAARVQGNQDLGIDFTSGQLNDVLKSLTIVDLGEGRIASVRYNSIAPLDERLRTLRLPFGEQVNDAEFLTALRGARTEVRSGSASASGRLLSVEKQRRQNAKGDYIDVTVFSLVTEGGEMKNFELTPSTSVRITERDLSEEVGRYLNLVGSSRARDLRRMTISATGTGSREVFVSYISEVPVWKSTYRILLPDKPTEKPLLQGWAIVDNTVGEDWQDVQLSLVAGAPQSFIQNISQPYYTRRPSVALPSSYMLTPQTHEGTLTGSGSGVGPGSAGGTGGGAYRLGSVGQLAPGATGLQGLVTDPAGAVIAGAKVTVRNEVSGETQSAVTDAQGVYRFYSVPSGNVAVFIESQGFKRFELSNIYLGAGRMNEINGRLEVGGTSETVEVRAAAPLVATSSAVLSAALPKQHIEAEGKDVGDFFEYDIRQKITIGRNQSALVPILGTRVEGEKVSLWSEGSPEIRRALWITNTSGLTLDSGTFNILEGETFAGEGILEAIHPGERRLISYAADPALRIALDQEEKEKPVSHLRIAKGTMVLTREHRDHRKYSIRNSDKSPRQVVIEHPAREGWKLIEPGPKPEETSTAFMRFRVNVAPNSTQELSVEEAHPEETDYELSELDSKQVALFVENQSLTPAAQQALRRVLDHKNQVDSLEAQIKSRGQEVESISKDQARVRENMKALKGSPEEKALLQRYARELDQQENRLDTLQKQVSDLNEQEEKASEELERIIQEITLDETL